MLTELTRQVVQIAEANGTKLEPFDPFGPLDFAQNAGQAAADHAFANMHNHRLKSAKKHSGMWRVIAVRKRKTELETFLLPVLQAGERHSVKMRLNTLLAKMVQEFEAGKRRQIWQYFNELKNRMASTAA
jgi:2-dehydropantoate 2-reductase